MSLTSCKRSTNGLWFVTLNSPSIYAAKNGTKKKEKKEKSWSSKFALGGATLHSNLQRETPSSTAGSCRVLRWAHQTAARNRQQACCTRKAVSSSGPPPCTPRTCAVSELLAAAHQEALLAAQLCTRQPELANRCNRQAVCFHSITWARLPLQPVFYFHLSFNHRSKQKNYQLKNSRVQTTAPNSLLYMTPPAAFCDSVQRGGCLILPKVKVSLLSALTPSLHLNNSIWESL